MKRFRGALLVLLVVMAAAAEGAPQLHFESVPLPEVPAENQWRPILQDHTGFLWFGMTGSLYRYDGYEMRAYDLRPTLGGLPIGQRISALCEDSDGDLWVGTEGAGLYRLDRRTGDITAYHHDDQVPDGLGSNAVSALFEDAGGTLWVGFDDACGLSSFDRATGRFTTYCPVPTDPQSVECGPVTSFAQDSSGRLLLATRVGLKLFEPASGRCRRFPPRILERAGISGGGGVRLLSGADGAIWAVTSGALSRWDAAREAFHTYRPAGSVRFVDAAAGPDGTVWIGSRDGLYGFDTRAERFRFWSAAADEGGSPSGTVYVDRSGVVWTMTGTGCRRWDPDRVDFAHILLPEEAAEPILQGGYPLVIRRGRNGRLWLVVLHPSDTPPYELVEWKPATGSVHRYPVPGRAGAGPAFVRDLAVDANGVVWLTTTAGLATLVPGAGEVRFLRTPRRLTDFTDDRIASDRRGELWIGTAQDGLFRFDPRTGRLQRYVFAAPGATRPDGIAAVFVDTLGRVWIGCAASGVHVHLPGEIGFRHLFDRRRGLEAITTLVEDRDRRIWAGTVGGGLQRLDAEHGSVDKVTTVEGLPSNTVLNAVSGAEGALWLVCGGGLVRFDPDTRALREYGASDGLPPFTGYWSSQAASAGDGGWLYVGNQSRLVAFRTADIGGRAFRPPVVVTELEVSGQPATRGSNMPLGVPSRLELPHRRNNLTFGFAALDFSRPRGNHYAYRLEGYDHTWHYVGSQHSATFTNLDPGRYVFRVRGSNGEGVWSGESEAIAVTILPPWWQTWWAVSAFVVILLGTGTVLVRGLVSRERLRSAICLKEAETTHLQQVDRLKSRFFANISHEFRTPLTLLLGPLAELRGRAEDGQGEIVEGMWRNARRLLELVDQLLDLARLEGGKMRLEVRCGKPAETVRLAVESFQRVAERKRITLECRSSQRAAEAWFDPDALQKIVGNLLSNAVKFTPDEGHIEVACEVSEASTEEGEGSRFLDLAVSDSGPGIPPGERDQIFERFYRVEGKVQVEGTGIGLALVRELVELHGGTIDVADSPSGGAAFMVRLPIDAVALAPEQHRPDEGRPLPAPAPGDGEPCAGDAGGDAGAAGPEADSSRPLVLVVEDNDELRTYLRSQLAGFYEVAEAGDGSQALAVALERVPEVVVSDVMMPAMDGFELCRRLKTDERTSHVAVLLLTARSGIESKLEGLETGADDYLVKPFDSRELRVRIRNLIVQRRRLRERYSHEVVAVEPEAAEVTSIDERFLRRAREAIEQHLDDADLTVETFAALVHMSRMQLHRKLKALTGMPAREFIRTYRLKRAAQLLDSGYGHVTDVAWAVGFKSLPHFTESFRHQFGVNPSGYRTRNGAGG